MAIRRNSIRVLALGTMIAGVCVAFGRPARSQAQASRVCDEGQASAARAAMRLVCRQTDGARAFSTGPTTIVVGFVGGYANPGDVKHPEVLFAAYLREHYGSSVHAEVFSNHGRRTALRYVLQFLDSNDDGALSAEEKNHARVIIYGHSWGASETAAFARELGRRNIPVLLTLQLDIVPKPGERPVLISSNVANAVNFYQAEGALRGSSTITAANPMRTEILGNFQFTYRRERVNCDNYPWFARTFNKPHHEIENDPIVWARVAAFIEAQMRGAGPAKDLPVDAIGQGEMGGR
jgi:pimeloyl-ACP methyl ester carboxylesterase